MKVNIAKFLKAYRRLCCNYVIGLCNGCPLYDKTNGVQKCDLHNPDTDLDNLVYIVELWDKEHPQKTMAQDFFERFPNAPKTAKGLPRNICPSDCGYTNEPPDTSVCNKFDGDCLKCWSRSLED